MNLKQYSIIIALLLISGSCKKRKYPSDIIETGDAVFFFRGSVDGKDMVLKAGINSYYMYSSFEQDSNGVYGLTSELKPLNCGLCPRSLYIKINDTKASQINSGISIDSVIKPKKYNFLEGDGIGYEVQFSSKFNKPVASYLWDFGDGTTSTESDPRHFYRNPGNYRICLGIKSQNACSGNICNMQKIDENALLSNIIVNNVQGNAVNFSQQTFGGNGNYTYFWNFGDGGKSQLAQPTHNYNIPGSYPVSLKVVDADNNTTLTNFNVSTQTDSSSCNVNYSIASIKRLSSALSTIVIKWVDENNIVYESNAGSQPGNSNFEIVSVEDFDKNEKGMPTKKVRVKFRCNVYNGSKALAIECEDAVISVAYK